MTPRWAIQLYGERYCEPVIRGRDTRMPRMPLEPVTRVFKPGGNPYAYRVGFVPVYVNTGVARATRDTRHGTLAAGPAVPRLLPVPDGGRRT